MKQALLVALSVSLLCGTLVSVTPMPGVTVYVHDLASLVVIFITIAVKRKRWSWPSLIRPILGFTGVALTSLLFASFTFSRNEIIVSSLYLVRWFLYAWVFVALYQWKFVRREVHVTLFWTGVFFALCGLVQFVAYPDLRNLWYLGWDPHYYRLFSTLLDPNYAGLLIILTMIVGMSLKKRMIHWISICALFLSLYLTYSRSSYVAFSAAVGTWMIMRRDWRLLIILFVLLGALCIPPPGGNTLRLNRIDSTVSRIENWQGAWELVRQRPVFGWGFNTLRFVPRAKQTQELQVPVSHAQAGVDNSALFLFATCGIIGVCAYTWLVWESRKNNVWYWSSFSAIAVHSMFVNSAFYPWILLWGWMLLSATERVKVDTK